MSKLMEFIDGKKTHMVAAGVFIVAGLAGLGVLDEATSKALLGMLTGTGIYTFRDAMRKQEKK